jgi:hypothetical protein
MVKCPLFSQLIYNYSVQKMSVMYSNKCALFSKLIYDYNVGIAWVPVVERDGASKVRRGSAKHKREQTVVVITSL